MALLVAEFRLRWPSQTQLSRAGVYDSLDVATLFDSRLRLFHVSFPGRYGATSAKDRVDNLEMTEAGT